MGNFLVIIVLDDKNQKSFAPDKREKYDIYVPLEKDDDNDDEEFIKITKKKRQKV